MAASKPDSQAVAADRLWLHVKILYLILTFVVVSFSGLLWVSFIQIHQLRHELALKLSHSVVEFENMDRRSKEGPTSTGRGQNAAPLFEDAESEQLVNVKTRVRRQAPFHDGGGSGGHLGGAPDDWVWMSSYSRVPVSTNFYSNFS